MSIQIGPQWHVVKVKRIRWVQNFATCAKSATTSGISRLILPAYAIGAAVTSLVYVPGVIWMKECQDAYTTYATIASPKKTPLLVRSWKTQATMTMTITIGTNMAKKEYNYVVGRLGEQLFSVAKFEDGREAPSSVYNVTFDPATGTGLCNCPAAGWRNTGSNDKHVALVRDFLKQGGGE
jgi:hypothetical protein